MPDARPIQDDHVSEFEELRRLSPKVTGGLLPMRQEAYRDATVAAKYKILTAMAFRWLFDASRASVPM
jgi:hypothetical protein